MKKLLLLAIVTLTFKSFESNSIQSEIDDYIEITSKYYHDRNVRILTHFTCYTQSNV